MPRFHPFVGPNELIRSAGRIKRLLEIDFDVKHPIVLDARHAFVMRHLQKIPSCHYPTNHGRPPSRKIRIPVSFLHEHRGRLLRPVLRYCT